MTKTRLTAILTLLILSIILAGCLPVPPSTNQTSTPTAAVIANTTVLVSDEPTNAEKSSETNTAAADGTLPRKIVTEGELVSFPNLKATDPDGDPITYTFTKPLDAKGQWQTKVGDAGEYKVTITASDGKNSVSQVVIIQVNAKNRPPKIELASKEIKIKEGDTIKLDVKATDPDGDKVTLNFDGWMKEPTRTTDYKDAGMHEVYLTASDGKVTSTETVRITVENVNRAPTINQIEDTIVKEGDKITVNPKATDADGDRITFIYGSPLSASGTWQPAKADVGKYRINITASDGSLTATTTFLLVFQALNQPPVITMNELVTVDEGQTVKLAPEITDPEGDKLTITYSGWMTSNTYTTTYEDSGSHLVTITVNDGVNIAKKDVTVMVNDLNRPPTFGADAFN